MSAPTSLSVLPLAAFLFAVSLSGNVRALPTTAGIRPCPVGSVNLEKCIAEGLNTYIPLLANGWGKDVPNMDPLMIPFIDAEYDGDNVTLSLNMKNIVIVGLADTRVYAVRAKSLEEGKLELMCKTPKITATGVYKSEGAVITFPLHSTGPFNVTLGDLTSHLVIHLIGMNDHIQATDVGLNVMPSLIDLQGGRQLDEDNNLGEALNVYLSENSLELYELVRPRLMNYFSEVIKAVVNTMFSQTSTSSVFPDLDLRK